MCGVIAVVVLLLVATLAFSIGKELGLKQVPLCSPCPACERCEQSLNQPSTDPTAGWKIYDNTKYGFTINYPPTWRAENNDQNTATLKNDLIGQIIIYEGVLA
ncbi:MAG: hypothetical protein Q8N98_00725, partial [bacterium]|nr:hypothetical protein [bacterium]